MRKFYKEQVAYLMLEDSAEALDETLVATLDNLWVNSCFLAAAREASESSLLEGVGILIGVTNGVELVGCDVVFGSPGTTFGRDERRPLSSLRLMSSLDKVTLDVAASRIVRRKVANCSSCDLKTFKTRFLHKCLTTKIRN
jgi:hypothetical protein